ncbi:MAG: Ig-like domain repeat protein [Planctomycetes bacterium]|nr:Ig-like domain repeat protein [Planctomycetota bacterium]
MIAKRYLIRGWRLGLLAFLASALSLGFNGNGCNLTDETDSGSSSVLIIKANSHNTVKDNHSTPGQEIDVPAQAVDNDTEIDFIPFRHSDDLPEALPDGCEFLGGANLKPKHNDKADFNNGKEADCYVILPDNVRAEELSNTDIKLMEFIDGHWVIVLPDKKGKVHEDGPKAGYIGPDEENPAKLTGIRPFCWVRVKTDKTAPGTPDGLVATATSSCEIRLTWNTAADNVAVNGYRVYRNDCDDYLEAVADTSYTDTGLAPSTAYCYFVRAYDAAGNFSNPSVTATATTLTLPDTTPPSVPIGLAATAVSPSQINLSWNASTDNVGVTGYKLYRNGALISTISSIYSYSDTGLAASTGYRYTVAAYDAAGNVSAFSNMATATTLAPPDITAPTTPVSLTAVAVSPNQINLAWNPSKDNVGVVGYKIYRNATCITSVAAASYINVRLAPSTTYSYTVAAYDAAGNISAFSNIAAATTLAPPDITAPTVPVSLTAVAVSHNQINLAWKSSTDNVGVAGYKVYRNGALLLQLSATSYSNTGLAASTTYSYSVAAYDAAGNTSAQCSPVSANTWPPPDTAPPSVPAGLVAAPISVSHINLFWKVSTDNVGVAGYRIYRNGAFIASVLSITYSDAGLAASTTYSYTVAAYDAAGNVSAHSNLASAITLTPPDTTPPSVPTGLNALAVSTSQINLTWSASTDNLAMGGYKVYRNGTYIISVGAASYSDAGLFPSTTYSYAVAAYDAAGNISAHSNLASATTLTPPDTSAPSIPTGLIATTVSSNQIDIIWNAPTDNVAVVGYKVYRNGALCSTLYATNYSDTGLTSATTYNYTVAAYDATGNTSAYSNMAVATTLPAPGAQVPFQIVLSPTATGWEIDGVGKPCLLKENGIYKMWYRGNNYWWAGSYYQNDGSIGYAESADGTNWSNRQRVHVNGTVLNDYRLATDPWVMKENGSYRMWQADYYTWIGGDWSYYITHLTSADGINWANEKTVLTGSGNLSNYDDYCTSQPSLVKEANGAYSMWYGVNQRPRVGVGGPSNITRASSIDGITWTNKQLALARVPGTSEENVLTPDVIKESDGTYTMYYTAASGPDSVIYRATSADGINWTGREQILNKTQLRSDILGISSPHYFKDTDGTEYLYFSLSLPATEKAGYKEYIGRVQLGYIIASVSPAPAANPGPIAWWKFDETSGATAMDSTGNGHHGTVSGATWSNGCLSFDGLDDYVRVPNSPLLNPQGSFSVDAWIFPTTDRYGHILTKWGDTGDWSGQRAYALSTSSGRLVFGISDDAHQQDSQFHVFTTQNGILALNSWNHMTAVYDKSTGTRKIYINGTKIDERTDAPVNLTASMADIAIGGHLASSTILRSTFFQGRIDEVKIYNYARSAAEIQADYSANR